MWPITIDFWNKNQFINLANYNNITAGPANGFKVTAYNNNQVIYRSSGSIEYSDLLQAELNSSYNFI